MSIYQEILNAHIQGRKNLAVLLDPDKLPSDKMDSILKTAEESKVDYFFVGGSLLVEDKLDDVFRQIRKSSDIPTVLFPGNSFQLSNQADAVLFLSLISGRNPEMLIGHHVLAAPFLRNNNIEVIPTGYILIDGGLPTAVSYMSNTRPIPRDKVDIAQCTAIAGQFLGLKLIYLEAGSGAINSVSEQMIHAVKSVVNVPLIVGGGINSPEKARAAFEAGADLIVIGSAVERDSQCLREISSAIAESEEPLNAGMQNILK